MRTVDQQYVNFNYLLLVTKPDECTYQGGGPRPNTGLQLLWQKQAFLHFQLGYKTHANLSPSEETCAETHSESYISWR